MAVVQVDRGCLVAGYANAKVADAPDREAGAGEVGFCKGDVWQRQLEIGTILDLLRFKRLLRKCRNRDWHVLSALRLALRGNNNDIVIKDTIVSILRQGGYGHCRYSCSG